MKHPKPSTVGAARALIHDVGFPYARAANLLAARAVVISLEAIALGGVVPILDYISADRSLQKLAETKFYWPPLIEAYETIGIDISLVSLSVVVFTTVLLRQVANFMHDRIMIKMAGTYVRDVQITAFRRLMSLSVPAGESMGVGNTVSGFMVEMVRAASAVLAIVPLIGDFALILFYVALMLYTSVELTALAFAGLGMIVLTVRFAVKGTSKASQEFSTNNNELSEFASERMRLFRTVKLAGRLEDELSVFGRYSNRAQSSLADTKLLSRRIPLFVQPAATFLILSVLVIGLDVLDMEIVDILLLTGMFLRLVPFVQTVVSSAQGVVANSASLFFVLEMLQRAREYREDTQNGTQLSRPIRAIAFKNVQYAYPDTAAQALTDVTTAFHAGEVSAVVGRSGAGKSTLVDMIPRIREPDSGLVTIDDRNVTEISLTSLREAIAYVAQTPLIASGAIRDHLCFRKRDVDEQDLWAALDLVDMKDFVESLPDRLDTHLGVRGTKLSGGQRQRLELARALVENPLVLILDEPTSGLDIETERIIESTLHRMAKERQIVIIVIAHSLSLACNADKIVVLESGGVAEQGTHHELWRRNGTYKRMLEHHGGITPKVDHSSA